MIKGWFTLKGIGTPALAVFLALPGCISLQDIPAAFQGGHGYSRSVEWVSQKTRYRIDETTGTEIIQSPEMDVYLAANAFAHRSYVRLRKLPGERYQIYAITNFPQWNEIHSAYDGETTKLKLEIIDTKILKTGRVTQRLAIPVSRKYLEQLVDQGGTEIRLIGLKENGVFFMPPNLVEGFLVAIDSYPPGGAS